MSLIDLLFPSLILLVLVVLSATFFPTFPLLAAGLCWYLVTLLPVIGLIQVGSQAHADRYMYLPSIGILIASIYLLPSKGKRHFQLSSTLSVLFIAYLATISYWQISYWENRNTLFSRVLDVLGPNYKAHIHLVDDYKQRGMLKEARQHSMAARNIRAGRPHTYLTKANMALAKREFQEAEKLYRLALSKGGESAELLNNFGITMAEQGHTKAAIEAFEGALRIEPTLVEPQKNLERYGSEQEQATTP
jgi:tetratricopeptide (TPR) repeat protein